MVAGTPGFTFGGGEVWAVHAAWSGNHTHYAERTPEGECLLGGGELLGAGRGRAGPRRDLPLALAARVVVGLAGSTR